MKGLVSIFDIRPHIIKWAWHQVFESVAYWCDLKLVEINLEKPLPKTMCISCNTFSIEPIHTKLFPAGIIGLQCNNKECPKYHVTIPWKMFMSLKRVPLEYIPIGFKVPNSEIIGRKMEK